MKQFICGRFFDCITQFGWPKHRGNGEFGSYFPQARKHREFCFNTWEKFGDIGRIF